MKSMFKSIALWIAIILAAIGGTIGTFLIMVIGVLLRALPFIVVLGAGFWLARYFGVI